MSDLVVGFHDEIYMENCSLRHRSEENRKRCVALEQKIARLEHQTQNAKAEAKKMETQCNEELGEMEARLAAAIDTIEALKEDNKRSKQEYFRLLKEYNERAAYVVWLEDGLKHARHNNEQVVGVLAVAEQNMQRLKEVNAKVVGELKRVNAQLNE